MKTRILIAAVLAACLTSVQARIGETEAQCVARYGAVVERGHDEDAPKNQYCTFHSGRFDLKIYFTDGKAGEMMIFPQDKTKPFSDDELEIILSANAGSSIWSQVPSGAESEGLRHFKRSDGGATATLIAPDKVTKWSVLTIETFAHRAAMAGLANF